ncbi:ImmA/IrrE family metallo-endopeptidase [Lactiplantibacillus plantarum]|uniref:ImmA/IrrE family metallo-endopeptidase n=1 Tax=Lactiplantibacillus plantarum TaxID=1590 RepID=UPI0015ECC8B0|nr:ImmA/IrrE family metallo-endopeptidase [Lactiplantibacillus plantarum]QLQ50931.1 ImmA/IrrE family metallo-endopeptidase [Lactiplantibacillus plantarum]
MAFEKNAILEAHKLIKKYNTSDPYELAKRCGFIVLYADLGDVNYAQRDYYKRINVITLNSKSDENLQRYSLAHEIGHAILHHGFSTAFFRKSSGCGMVNWAEKDANDFAMQIMLANFSDDDVDSMTNYELVESMGLEEKMVDYIN